MKCPSCGESLRTGETLCACGWRQKGGKSTSTTDRIFPCDYCSKPLFYPTRSSGTPNSNHIVGRSYKYGYICADCHGDPVKEERGPIEDACEAFAQAHVDDGWGSLLRAAKDTKGKEAGVMFFAALKAQAKKSGGLTKKLPYNKSQRQANG